MSHYTVLVIGPNVEEQLAPYDENIRVDSYERDCYCIDHAAHREAFLQAQDKLGKTIEDLRASYGVLDPKDRPDWDEYIKPLVDLEKQFHDEHPLKDKPSNTCEECHGTGKHKSNYNPRSKWDWYSIGGRWSGYFKTKADANHPPELGQDGVFHSPKRELELRTDVVLKGDLDLPGMLADARAEYEAHYTDTMVQLRNKEIKEESFEMITGIRLGETREQYMERKAPKTPGETLVTFAVVKDGEWYERGQMGWWGMVSDEKDKGQWEREFAKLFDELPDNTQLTLVDCHI